MKVKSFIKHGIEWCPVEIELNFLPGLPQFHFLGLPDAALKESQLRIKAAIKHQGFDWPKGKQVVVNMRPQNIRKSSQGLELAIACAFLWATGQVKKSQILPEVPWIYGELGLGGEVYAPGDVYRAESELGDDLLVTGKSSVDLPFSVVNLSCLKELSELELSISASLADSQDEVQPSLPNISFCKKSAELLQVIAAGEHSALFVGPAGSGKTTLCENLKYLLPQLSRLEKKEVKKWALAMDWPHEGRPFVMPHHSTPNISMIGGGSPPLPGEITRANNGVLLLDELLEFSPVVKESLREPIVSGKISVSRRGVRREFPANFLLLATSNLCPCGGLVPGKFMSCRFSLTRCRSYTEKLSGPLADRFCILSFSHEWKNNGEVTLSEIKQKVTKAREFSQKKRFQEVPNSKVYVSKIQSTYDEFLAGGGMPELFGSRRRFEAVLRVARTLADLDQVEKIGISHINKAMAYTVQPFSKLQNIFA